MGCEICGRRGCAKSFHSSEEVENFDRIADVLKDRVKNSISRRVSNIDGEYIGDDYYVKLDDVISVIDDYY